MHTYKIVKLYYVKISCRIRANLHRNYEISVPERNAHKASMTEDESTMMDL